MSSKSLVEGFMFHARTAFAVCLALLLVAGASTVVAYAFVPTEVESEVTLLNYQHAGELDYTAEMGPSSLYGTAPAPEPENPRFPALIIKDLDFSFSYKPSTAATGTARVDAVLENPGIWSKTIPLVTLRPISGELKFDFKLDLEAMKEAFTTIETETGLRANTRDLTLRATVDTDKEQFTQTLLMRLSETVLEVQAAVSVDRQAAFSAFDYTVNLKPNSIYDSGSLKPPPYTPQSSQTTTVGAGKSLLLKLAERIDFSYDYKLNSTQVITDTKATVSVEVYVKATGRDGAEFWSRKLPVATTAAASGSGMTFSLDVAALTSVMDAIRVETGVSANNLTINARVHTTATTPFGPVDNVFNHAVTATVSGNALEWDGERTLKESGTIVDTRQVPNPIKIANVITLPDARMMLTWLTGGLALGSVLLGAVSLKTGSSPLPEVENEARQARRRLKDLLVEVSWMPDLSKATVIPMATLPELANTAQGLLKPIIHYSKSGWHIYVVVDGDIVYRYIPLGGAPEPITPDRPPQPSKKAK